MKGTILRDCYKTKCLGKMVCTKTGGGSPFEFMCSECKVGMSIMNAISLDPKDREIFEKWFKVNVK